MTTAPQARRPLSERGTATYSAHQIAGMLGIQLNKVYIEAAAGAIPNFRFGRRFIFPRAAIDAWLATAGGSVDLRDAK